VGKRVTGKQQKVKSMSLEFEEGAVTSFGGMSLAERLAMRLGLWSELSSRLPSRRGYRYDWMTVIKSMVTGLLSGSRGTYAAEEVREDEALLTLLGLEGAPEEATVWRTLEELGREDMQQLLRETTVRWVRRVLKSAPRRELLKEGFFPVFGDGTLLEGSRKREGTKWIEDKGEGLVWATWFAGPLLAAQTIAGEGEGESTCLRRLFPVVVKDVLKALRLKEKALVLLDSLHGDEPTLRTIEKEGVHYIVGANKLAETARALEAQPESVWVSTGVLPRRGWIESGVCECWIMCESWEKKRVLIGRRYRKEGEFLYHYSGVITDVERPHVRHVMKRRKCSYGEAIWHLYDLKGAHENSYKEPLEDLGLHHPPCREYVRNAGFYAVASLSCVLGRAVDLIGGKGSERGSPKRKDGTRRKRVTPASMRLWRLRRRLFSLPGRVVAHARKVTITLLGVGPTIRHQYEHYWLNVSRC
jgi:hypothetical protein